jgi:hypothetical protein
MMFRDAILANDHQAHNATAVSGAGHPREFIVSSPCDDEERWNQGTAFRV